MNFFFKNKPIQVDAFIYNPGILKLFPIKKAKEFTPEWWKKIPPGVIRKEGQEGVLVERSTIKRCPGFHELYTKGFMIPLWTDIAVETYTNGACKAMNASEQSGNYVGKPEFHNPEQYGNAFSDFIQLKLSSPWFIKEKTGVKFLVNQPTWNLTNMGRNVQVFPGVLDFKYQHSSNINIMFPKIDNRFMLEAGTPMAHLVPISDKDINLNIHELTEEEAKKLYMMVHYSFSFVNTYKKIKSLVKRDGYLS